MIRVVHPRSRILIFYPSRTPDPGSRGQKGIGSRIQNSKTAVNDENRQCFGSALVSMRTRKQIQVIRLSIKSDGANFTFSRYLF
jgi:hypothetical protein